MTPATRGQIGRRLPWAAPLLLLAFLLPVGAAQEASRPFVARATEPATAPATNPAPDGSARVHGIVLDPAGKPVAGAQVVVVANRPNPNLPPPEPIVEARTGADGRFDLPFRKPAPQFAAANFAGVPGLPAVLITPAAGTAAAAADAAGAVPAVVASADGYGAAWGRSDRGGDTSGAASVPLGPERPGDIRWGDVALRLVRDHPINGHVWTSRVAPWPA